MIKWDESVVKLNLSICIDTLFIYTVPMKSFQYSYNFYNTCKLVFTKAAINQFFSSILQREKIFPHVKFCQNFHLKHFTHLKGYIERSIKNCSITSLFIIIWFCKSKRISNYEKSPENNICASFKFQKTLICCTSPAISQHLHRFSKLSGLIFIIYAIIITIR